MLNTRTGGEFSVSKGPDELGYYNVSMCSDGCHAFKTIQSLIILCKTYDKRSNIEVEITRLIVY